MDDGVPGRAVDAAFVAFGLALTLRAASRFVANRRPPESPPRNKACSSANAVGDLAEFRFCPFRVANVGLLGDNGMPSSVAPGAGAAAEVDGEDLGGQRCNEAGRGFPSKQTALRDEVDRALEVLPGPIESLEAKYGLPTAAPVRLADAGTAALPAAVPVADPTVGETGTPPSAPADAEDGQQVEAGQKLFNANCAHCHSPDAVHGDRRINLRLLQHR